MHKVHDKREMEFGRQHQVYLLSNANTDQFPANALTHFTNILPIDELKDRLDGEWEICLSEIAFQNKFLNRYFPPYLDTPTIAMIEKQPTTDDDNGDETSQRALLTLKDIPPAQKIFFPHKRLTQHELHQLLVSPTFNQLGLNFTYVRGGQDRLQLWFSKSKAKKFHLLIHVKFATYLFGDPPPEKIAGKELIFQRRYLDGQQYWQFDGAANFHDYGKYSQIVTQDTRAPLPDILGTFHTSLILVQSPNVAAQNFNSRQLPLLAVLGLPKSGYKGYWHVEFDQKLYVPLQTSHLPRSLTVKLTNSAGDYLKLAEGSTTICKVLLRKRHRLVDIPRMSDFIIRVTSEQQALWHQDNTKSKFSVTLPHALPLQNFVDDAQAGFRWRVALTSISFPGRFKMGLSEEERTITATFKNKRDTTITYSFDVIVPDVTHSAKEICREFGHQTNFAWEAKVQPSHGGISLDGREDYMWSLTMSKSLHFFLGGNVTSAAQAAEGSSSGSSPNEKLTFQQDQGEDYKFPKLPRYNELIPSNMFVYCNIIAPTPLGGQPHTILRVIPLTLHQNSSQSLIDDFITMEFRHLDFHEISIANPKTLSFEIRQQDGSLVDFNNVAGEEVLLTLLFSTYQ